MSATLSCTSVSGEEKMTTRLTTPLSRIGSATWPSSTSPRYCEPRASRFVRAATSAIPTGRSSSCTSVVESVKIEVCRPSVPLPTMQQRHARARPVADRRDELVDLARGAVVDARARVIFGVWARAVRASELSFCSRSEDSSCGVT